MTTTSWRTEWNAISARIDGLVRAGEFFYRSIEKRTEDDYGVLEKVLLPEASELYDILVAYREQYNKCIPAQAAECLNRFIARFYSQFKGSESAGTLAQNLPLLQVRLTVLSASRSQLEFLLAGLEDEIRATAERAFSHLQRCIVADSRYRAQWGNAFGEGELSCERLGAVHLLWHGIWAFKVAAAGGRTDLVMGDRIDNPSEAERTAFGMVLTEWKRATSDSEIDQRYGEGRSQAAHYSSGILGGVELASVRYVVVVTSDLVKKRDDVVEGSLTYRFVNIAVDPRVPSLAGRRNA